MHITSLHLPQPQYNVYVFLDCDTPPLPSFVVDIRPNDTLTIARPGGIHPRSVPLTGDPLMLSWRTENGYFRATTTFIGAERMPEPIWVLSLLLSQRQNGNRQYFRTREDLTGSATFLRKESQQPNLSSGLPSDLPEESQQPHEIDTTAEVLDLSQGGIGIVCSNDQDISVGDTAEVVVPLPDGTVFTAAAVVRHLTLGLEFTEISEENARHLQRHIIKKLMEKNPDV